MIVVDASVFNKLFLDEDDKDSARAFFKWSVTDRISAGAPDLIRLEICQAALHFGLPFAAVLGLLESQCKGSFRIVPLRRAHWDLAEEIATTGHPKTGYPSLIDSLYHAVALVEGGTLLTADRRHRKKAAAFGGVALLSEWETLRDGAER